MYNYLEVLVPCHRLAIICRDRQLFIVVEQTVFAVGHYRDIATITSDGAVDDI